MDTQSKCSKPQLKTERAPCGCARIVACLNCGRVDHYPNQGHDEHHTEACRARSGSRTRAR